MENVKFHSADANAVNIALNPNLGMPWLVLYKGANADSMDFYEKANEAGTMTQRSR